MDNQNYEQMTPEQLQQILWMQQQQLQQQNIMQDPNSMMNMNQNIMSDPNSMQQQFTQQAQMPYGNMNYGQDINMMNMMNNQSFQPINMAKKKFNKFILLIPFVFLVIGIFAVKAHNAKIAEEKKHEIDPTTQTGVYAYNNLINALHSFDTDDEEELEAAATNLDAVVGSEDGDSYLAQEWAYVNKVQLREELIKKVYTSVEMSVPAGSSLNNGEEVSFTVPDYEAISNEIDSQSTAIKKLYKSSKYKPKDYEWHDEMNNLLCQYLLDYSSFPTKTVSVALGVGLVKGTAMITDDSALDNALFGNEEFHTMVDKFSQIAMSWTGYRTEKYKTKAWIKNPEYAKWKKLFNKYYKADKGRFKKGVSKWEPWYVRDDDNNLIYDENGEKKVNYYSVKKADGTDWIEPDKKVRTTVTKKRKVEVAWMDEDGCTYTMLGTYFMENEYTGDNDTTFRVGDGTKEFPAGIGTTIITKAKGTDKKWHDVRIALVGYWIGQDAIDYVESFDKRNKGFTTTSAVQLISYEMEIENLEKKPFTVVGGMALSDGNSNISSRTGTMYGFESKKKLKPGKKTLINDWATSTELDQKYVVWGKGFDRDYHMVYFNVLAGTGYIPEYSAYKYFTGKSSIDENVNIQSSTNNGSKVTENSTDKK